VATNLTLLFCLQSELNVAGEMVGNKSAVILQKRINFAVQSQAQNSLLFQRWNEPEF
jgi:hypothetical protein